jgi:hypothetical protein
MLIALYFTISVSDTQPEICRRHVTTNVLAFIDEIEGGVCPVAQKSQPLSQRIERGLCAVGKMQRVTFGLLLPDYSLARKWGKRMTSRMLA